MNTVEAKKLAEAYIDCCHSGFEDRIGEVFAEDSSIHDTTTGHDIAPASYMEDVKIFRRAFPHVRFELTQWAMCDDNNMMVRWRLIRNSIPAEILEEIGGLREEYTGIDFLEIKDEKVIRTQSYLDRSGETLEYFARRINHKLNDQELEHHKAGMAKKDMSDKLVFENLKSLMIRDRLYLNAKMRMPQVAKSIGVSSNNLSRIVNQIASQNFNDFVNCYRIADAKILLENNIQANEKELAMGEISLKCGFKSQSVFNAVFKAHVGVTPLQYKGVLLADA